MIKNNNTINKLNWRYATKQFDPSKKLSEDQLFAVKEAFRLSPSSFGLQGWKFIHIVDAEKRSKLQEAAYGQTQIVDASELFVLTIPTNYGVDDVNKYVETVAEVRKMKIEDLTGLTESLMGFVSSKSQEQITAWLRNQIYIALGFVMAVCAVDEIDACPMEGFNAEKFDEILGLKEKNLTSVVCLPVGFRSEEDKYAKLPKVRFSQEDIFIEE